MLAAQVACTQRVSPVVGPLPPYARVQTALSAFEDRSSKLREGDGRMVRQWVRAVRARMLRDPDGWAPYALAGLQGVLAQLDSDEWPSIAVQASACETAFRAITERSDR